MVTLADGRQIACEVQVGSSYLAHKDPRPHIGLGALEQAPRVFVRWPDGYERVPTQVTTKMTTNSKST